MHLISLHKRVSITISPLPLTYHNDIVTAKFLNRYEFNDSDLRCACDTIDTWVDQVGKGRDNIPPEKMPWNAIRTLISQAVYGGRIDNEFDQRLLNTYLERMFTVARFFLFC